MPVPTPTPFIPPDRLLLGPGPSNVPPPVLEAMARPVIGHLDPAFIRMMEETKEMLRAVFRTSNPLTFPVSGTGSAGMEFCLVNLLEPGDTIIVGVNGVFGNRLCDAAGRCGASVVRVESDWGRIVEPAAVADALAAHPGAKAVALVHAETSTGALTPVEEISRSARQAGALLILDAVTSLGGCPVEIDAWGVDAVYSGTQKCLSCPPGLAPVSFSARALAAAANRHKPAQSWYLDANMLSGYWGSDRVYHHTAPISANYALHEALRLVLDEGLEPRWRRHQAAHQCLARGLHERGLLLANQAGHRLWQLNPVSVPVGVDEQAVRRRLLEEFHIEVGAGLGPLKGKIWRIGLMGANATEAHVQRLLDAFDAILPAAGHPKPAPTPMIA